MTRIKKTIRNVHLVLGFASGLVVFIVAITGCLYAFKDEIESLQSWRYAEARQQPLLPPSVLKEKAAEIFPGRVIHGIAYGQPGKAAEVIFYEESPLFYKGVFMEPCTAEVLHVYDYPSSFFAFVFDGHFYLWLPPDIGQTVVATSTLVFVAMLLTGIVLWWPKKGNRKQRFTIKWNARWRRKNYDLHSVFGFYASWVAIVLALTGLVWGFQWFQAAVYGVVGGERSLVYTEPPSVTEPVSGFDQHRALDQIWVSMRQEYPEAALMEVHVPHDEKSSLYVMIKQDEGTWWRTDYRYFDQYTLAEIEPEHLWAKFSEATVADKIMRLNYDIHVGAIGGLPGKILMFCASLLVASLPVTGTLMWWGRRQKKRSKRREKATASQVRVAS